MIGEQNLQLSESEQRLVEGLHRLGAETREREAPASLEKRLVAACRAQVSLPRRSAGRWWMVGSWAAALAVTAGLGFFLVRTHQPERTQRIPAHRRMTQFAAVEQAPDFESSELELPADFIPLPNVERLAPNEAVNLVRVQLSRSAMEALGLPVGDGTSEEEAVEADVMLGGDGLARAVRFLE